MREHATLKLTDGREFPVEIDSDELDQDQVVVHLLEGTKHRPSLFLDIIDTHLATAKPHPAGTTDRLLQEDQSRPH